MWSWGLAWHGDEWRDVITVDVYVDGRRPWWGVKNDISFYNNKVYFSQYKVVISYRNGKTVKVKKTTVTNPDGTKHTEVEEEVLDGGNSISNNRYLGSFFIFKRFLYHFR